MGHAEMKVTLKRVAQAKVETAEAVKRIMNALARSEEALTNWLLAGLENEESAERMAERMKIVAEREDAMSKLLHGLVSFVKDIRPLNLPPGPGPHPHPKKPPRHL